MSKKFDAGAPALIRHVVYLVGLLIAGVFAMGLLYADVLATGKKADSNSKSVKMIEQTIHELRTGQRLLIQSVDEAKKTNEKFRDKTGSTLERILRRLPRREWQPRADPPR